MPPIVTVKKKSSIHENFAKFSQNIKKGVIQNDLARERRVKNGAHQARLTAASSLQAFVKSDLDIKSPDVKGPGKLELAKEHQAKKALTARFDCIAEAKFDV